MNLVIVESPAKGRTIEKYLGKDYRVLASFGHVRDLPEGRLGVDVDHDFLPDYQLIPRAKKTLTQLKSAAKEADQIYLATDFDREGEAIAWHLSEALGLANHKSQAPNSKPKVARITFHEITKEAIQEAVKHPRTIDSHLVDAQQARRILDRLVGYKLSPFLWKKVMKGLSAGRVQSVAVRLIVDREREIEAFVAQEYWSIEAELRKTANGKQNSDETFTAQLVSRDGEKIDKLAISDEAAARALEQALDGAVYQVGEVTTTDQHRQPAAPFTTSTLQQEASRRLGFSAKKTMKLAQSLYEAGAITYMRTDSTNVATSAVAATRELIAGQFGADYLPAAARVYKTKAKGAQEAHEAIRPTDVRSQPNQIAVGDEDERRLYDLIWRRLVACQMTPAVLALTKITLTAQATNHQYGFAVTGSMIKFDGYLQVWPTKMEEVVLPTLVAGDRLDLQKLVTAQHFTEPPPRYNEASLIKALEEHGIGRPSTYAPTIATIVDRGYVRVERRVFYPQEIGMIVTDLLKEHFPAIVDIGFTAQMEEDLDAIAEGDKEWVGVLNAFYSPFAKLLEQKLETVKKQQLVTETTDEVCDKCGQPLVIKLGRFGKFLACTGFPACRNTKPLVVSSGVACPVCAQAELVERKTRRGKTFWSCNRYPECKAATWDLKIPAKLPDPNRLQWKDTKKTPKKHAPKST